MRTHTDNTLSITEEVFGPALQHGIHVIIKIQKLFIQTVNPMQKHLNGRTVERRKEFLRNDIPMQHDMYLLTIYPCRHLAVV